MLWRLLLRLPVDAAGVPRARRALGGVLDAFGVSVTCREEIQLALTEACANVVTHARPADSAQGSARYEIGVTIDPDRCEIEVTDTGGGLDLTAGRQAGPTDESGRGLALMAALVDEVHIASTGPSGTTLRLVKYLT